MVERVDANDGEALVRSIKATGFAIIKNHGIPESLLKLAYREWEVFFNKSTEFKRRYHYSKEAQAGWFPINSETAKGKMDPDPKEFYHLYPWYDSHPNVPATWQLFHAMEALAAKLLAMIEIQTPLEIRNKLSMPLASMIYKSPQTLMRVLHYPALTDEDLRHGVGMIRAAEHEDINMITLLPAATEPGLQVKDLNGVWHDVLPEPGEIVVNVGDMLQEATGGYYPSTSHRVISVGKENDYVPRYAMPLFLHANPNVQISERYKAIDYLNERLKELGLK